MWSGLLVQNNMAFFVEGIKDPATLCFRLSELKDDRVLQLIRINPTPESTIMEYNLKSCNYDRNEYTISAHFSPNSIHSAQQMTTLGIMRNTPGCILRFTQEPMQHISKKTK